MMVDLEVAGGEFFSQTFNGLNLSGKEICSTEFDNCTFLDCNFNEAIFSKCKFTDCCFIKCNLSVVKIPYSRFLDVYFEECKVIGVDWTKASWPSVTLCSLIKFQKCIINDSSFFGLKLQQIVIEECKAHDVDFREGDFGEANFTYTDFSYSLFSKTNLNGANFVEATNYNIDINSNQVKGAKFSRFEALSLLDALGIDLVD